MNQYKCLTENFNNLDKKIRCIIKKLDKYNLFYNYEKLDESIESISVYNTDFNTKIKVNTINVSVTNYTFNMESIKLGNYELIAILDHTSQNKQCNKNMIYILNNKIELPQYYQEIIGYCNHCNSNRKRNKTALLYSVETKEFKQVGITCLKEYTGINCIDVISGFTDIYDIINETNKCNINTDTIKNYKSYISTITYLSNCIYIINRDGYIKDKTRDNAYEFKEVQDNNCNIIANQVVEYFKNLETDCDTFMLNIKTSLLQNSIYRPNGFIAYSFIAYKKNIEKIGEIEKKQKNQKGYYGEIGKREIFKNLKIECVSTQNFYIRNRDIIKKIYKMTNEYGFIFIWKTQNIIDVDFINEIKGTIKAHSEYNHELQTELTRCKVLN